MTSFISIRRRHSVHRSRTSSGDRSRAPKLAQVRVADVPAIASRLFNLVNARGEGGLNALGSGESLQPTRHDFVV
jgi:hypothetical protein